MRLQDALSIGDLERLAQRRLPRVLFECIGSGVEDEQGVIRNEAAFHKHQLLARHLVDVSKRDQSTTVFGRTYDEPVRNFPDRHCRRSSVAAPTWKRWP